MFAYSTIADAEDIKLSTEERCYYVERFDKGVIAYDQLEIAETIGEGDNKQLSLL